MNTQLTTLFGTVTGGRKSHLVVLAMRVKMALVRIWAVDSSEEEEASWVLANLGFWLS